MVFYNLYPADKWSILLGFTKKKEEKKKPAAQLTYCPTKVSKKMLPKNKFS